MPYNDHEKKLENDRRYRKEHPEIKKASDARYRGKNAKKIKEASRLYHLTHREEKHKKSIEWARSHPDRWKAIQVRTYRKHLVEAREKKRQYMREHPEKRRESMRRQRAKNPEKFVIRDSVLRMIKSHALTKDFKSAKYVGCSPGFLRNHLESLFQPGMSWDNYGKGPGRWEVDHIIPLDLFPFDQDSSLLFVASHWSNLQPLWGKENSSKRNRFAA